MQYFLNMRLIQSKQIYILFIKARSQGEKEGERTVKVFEDILNNFMLLIITQKIKNKALFMIITSKELGIIEIRKRKKSIS